MSTIYDIAKKAGVSPTTVSKVFNNYTDVSQKTKEKVLRVAQEIGYVPNLSARSLKTNRSYLIGVVFSENVGIGLEHQFFSVVLESFRNSIGAYGYDTVFINNTLGNQKIGYLDHCKYRNVDGLFIITANPGDIDFSKLIESDIKCVTTDIIFENKPYVISDNYEGSKLAVNYFYDKGHRNIAHLSGPLEILAASQRDVGFREAMEERNLIINETNMIQSAMYKYDDAYKATKELFSRFTDENRPTALYASADIMAIAAMQALKDMNLNVPEDVSIIGFDDIALAKYASPQLTTVRQDKKRIGKEVAESIYKLINKEEVEHEVIIPVSIVERASVKTLKTE